MCTHILEYVYVLITNPVVSPWCQNARSRDGDQRSSKTGSWFPWFPASPPMAGYGDGAIAGCSVVPRRATPQRGRNSQLCLLIKHNPPFVSWSLKT